MSYVYGCVMYVDVLCIWVCHVYGYEMRGGGGRKEGGRRKDGMHSKREPTHRRVVGMKCDA